MIVRCLVMAGMCVFAAVMAGAVGAATPVTDLAETEYQFLEEPVSGEVDVRAQVTIEEGLQRGDVARIVFCYLDERAYLYLDVSKNGAELGKVAGGRREVLGVADDWPKMADGGVHHIIIKRRSWAIRVLCDGREVLTAYELFAPGEKIGSADRGIKVSDLHAQPIGEMMFSDGFERPSGEPSPWEVFLGTWETALPDTRNKKVDPTRSANPFSYVATGEEALSCVSGPGFWDDYEATVAAKATDGAIGLAFYVQDKDNYYLLRAWTTGPSGQDTTEAKPGTVALVRVAGGEETVLAEQVAGLRSGQWYKLGVRSSGGHLQGTVDGAVIVEARDGAFAQGTIGLYAAGGSKAQFDSVELAPWRSFSDSYGRAATLPITRSAGFWTVQNGVLRGRGGPRGGTGIGLTGCPLWSDYSVSADIKSVTARALGLYFGVNGPQDYYLFRWGPGREGERGDRQELWCIAGGKATCLAQRSERMARRRTYHVEALTDRSYVAVTVDGERVLEAAHASRRDSGPGRGRVGYHVEGGRGALATFDNLHVEFHRPPEEPASVTAQFAKEDTMADWARPAASWTLMGNGLNRYELPVWGDFDLRIALPAIDPATSSCSIGLRLAGTPEALAEAPPCLTLSTEKGARGVKSVTGDEPAVATSSATAPVLELERRGSCVIASLDGRPFAAAPAVGGDEAPIVGIEIKGGGVSTNDIELTSPHIIDDTFAGAPTRWATGAGDWHISDRWHCQPQWSWFCGSGADRPLLWHKSPFAGDMVAEFWAAIMMDSAKAPHYKHPSDLNGIVCGDGKGLQSGYSFVFAGDNNTVTRILRGGESVAETNAFKIGSQNEFHRHWYHCRLERSGGHLTFFVDGRKALEYDDPAPLPGGHMGIWTDQGNGILIARARIAFQRLAERSQGGESTRLADSGPNVGPLE